MIHGVKVPEKVIFHPESITMEEITSEPNAEVRRILTERFGVDRYLVESNATLIHFDQIPVTTGSERLMPRALLKDQFGDYYLEGTDGSTTRFYFMLVHTPNITEFKAPKTCREAHERICGLDETLCIAQS